MHNLLVGPERAMSLTNMNLQTMGKKHSSLQDSAMLLLLLWVKLARVFPFIVVLFFPVKNNKLFES